eukprot:TRINITY_DN14089_c0_g1_i7.p2 TRINITY_DN14089_c0_g1~~TRINITY_DN14089_c0_g1_i7.p2  ORF type:complete len:116 (+),score=35.39 TRINITY_DN14089_c0_g1_i7:87-434(+)
MCIRDRIKTSKEYTPDESLAPEIIMLNSRNLHNCFVLTAICGGMVAGILGLTGLEGLYFYLVMFVLGMLAVLVRLKFSPSPYFRSFGQTVVGELTAHILSYLLFWVIFHNLVNIY